MWLYQKCLYCMVSILSILNDSNSKQDQAFCLSTQTQSLPFQKIYESVKDYTKSQVSEEFIHSKFSKASLSKELENFFLIICSFVVTIQPLLENCMNWKAFFSFQVASWRGISGKTWCMVILNPPSAYQGVRTLSKAFLRGLRPHGQFKLFYFTGN